MKTSKRKSKCFKLFILLFLIGIIIGIIYCSNIKKDELKTILESVKSSDIIYKPLNNITDHLKILSVISLFSIIFIGLPISSGLIISEGFTFIFRIYILYKSYKIKGIIYSLIYYLICDGLYIFFLYIIFKRIILMCKKLYRLKIKNESFNSSEIYNILLKILYLIIFIFITDILVYFYADNILKIFAFLIK